MNDEEPCGCSCHVVPGVKHVAPCCEFPPMDETEEFSNLWRSPRMPRKIPGLDRLKVREPTPEEVEKLRESAAKAERESLFQDFDSRRRFCNE